MTLRNDMQTGRKRYLKLILPSCGILLLLGLLFAWRTYSDLRPFPEGLSPDWSAVQRVRLLDRNGRHLSITYQNQWNLYDLVPFGGIPLLLRQAFIESEDHRFYEHSGADWAARCHALLQNVLALRIVRGGSTITEQAVRMLHPRPRTFWSRWIEGFEATELEKRFSKEEILEFYLNQVPFSNRRRGILQAAHYYFDRDPDTLNIRETLALAVLVRAPTAMDLRKRSPRLEHAVAQLAHRLQEKGLISEEEYQAAVEPGWNMGKVHPPIEAGHFVGHVHRSGLAGKNPGNGVLVTTLDGPLQERIQAILDTRLRDLRKNDAVDGGVLVVDHERNEVLAWVNGGGLTNAEPGGWIDAVTTPRQPGSTLKPFLYSLAMEKGWTAATLIDDSPLTEPIRFGLHSFHNFSRTHYGPLRLREALGNSLNIPAVRTIRFTGVESFLESLHHLGFQSLKRSSDYYGEGLALGDGEVTLFELVQAYSALARRGEFRPLKLVLGSAEHDEAGKRVFGEAVSSLIADILSDPQARRLEFGEGHLLRFPDRTAVKTGTSSDYRDAWAVGFSGRYAAGVWMGRMDRRPMEGITGTSGAALVLRSIFAELNRYENTRPIQLHSSLIPQTICRITGMRAGPQCPAMREWFPPSSVREETCTLHTSANQVSDRAPPLPETADGLPDIRFLQPTPGLRLAMDPHIPDELETFAMKVPEDLPVARVEWLVDDQVAAETGPHEHQFLWRLQPGRHIAQARVWLDGESRPVETGRIAFEVR